MVSLLHFTGASLCLVTLATGCNAALPASDTNDVFSQDAASGDGNARRHRASDDQRLWTIRMNGCTGALIAPELMLTANHCQPRSGERYTSGAALAVGQRNDIVVTQVVEASEQLDYAIVAIKWLGGVKKNQRFPPTIATSQGDVSMSTSEGQGDEIFTVGFPGDKSGTWGATYAEGQAKDSEPGVIAYNIGTINGNSGGSVWRKRDHMLVGMTNAGPRRLGQAEWNTGDMNNARHWNFGAAMWDVYATSATLRATFPGGKNRYATDTGSASADTPAGLFAAIGTPNNAAVDAFTFHVSGPADATRMILCATADASACTDEADGVTKTIDRQLLGNVAVFKTDTAIDLQDGKVLTMVAFDTQNKRLGAKSFRAKSRP